MFFRIFVAIISVGIPFVGLFSGLYYLRIFKKTVVKRTAFAIVLMVLTIPITLIFLVSLFPSTINEEVTIEDVEQEALSPGIVGDGLQALKDQLGQGP